jgi:hypothetical protein
MSHLDDKILPLIDQMLLTHLFGSWNLCQDAISERCATAQPVHGCSAFLPRSYMPD